MKLKINNTQAILIIVFSVLLIDQSLKIWVKTNMVLGEMIPIIGQRVMIHFIENSGAALGTEIPGPYGKIILSIFRILAIGAIIYYLTTLVKKAAPTGLIVCISLVLAGAIGNIIDSAFYGLIFSESVQFGKVAEIFPEGGGYAPFLKGDVVDMFHCPMITWNWPQWLPFFGGESFTFFSPIFNVADSAITVGVISILIFQRKYFNEHG